MRRELVAMLKLAGPVVLAEIGWMCMGILDTLVSQSYGARRLDECLSWLHHGVVLSIVLTLPLMLLGWTAIATMSAWRLNDEVRRLAEPYMRVLLVGVL